MKSYKLTGEQYEIIREALEQFYYMCKDEGDDNKLNAITELEESLIDQALEAK